LGNIIEEEEPAAKKLKSTMNQVQCKDRVIKGLRQVNLADLRIPQSFKSFVEIQNSAFFNSGYQVRSDLGIFQLRILWSF